MRRISVKLSAAERRELQRVRSAGVHLAREVNRAHILAALDSDVGDEQIVAVLGVTRAAIWRTRSAYQEKGPPRQSSLRTDDNCTSLFLTGDL